MNISTNPWTFQAADVPAAIPLAASPTGMVQQAALGTVLMTSSGAHGLSVGQWVSYIGDTNGRFLGFYKVIAVPSGTTALLQNISSINPVNGGPFNSVIAASGGGSMLINQVQQNIRAEDISWQNVPVTATLILRDRDGQVVWQASSALASSNAQNRGKIMWFNGLTLDTITTPSMVLITIN